MKLNIIFADDTFAQKTLIRSFRCIKLNQFIPLHERSRNDTAELSATVHKFRCSSQKLSLININSHDYFVLP